MQKSRVQYRCAAAYYATAREASRNHEPEPRRFNHGLGIQGPHTIAQYSVPIEYNYPSLYLPRVNVSLLCVHYSGMPQ